MDKVFVWYENGVWYNQCACCGQLYPSYKEKNGILYALKKKCKCGRDNCIYWSRHQKISGRARG